MERKTIKEWNMRGGKKNNTEVLPGYKLINGHTALKQGLQTGAKYHKQTKEQLQYQASKIATQRNLRVGG